MIRFSHLYISGIMIITISKNFCFSWLAKVWFIKRISKWKPIFLTCYSSGHTVLLCHFLPKKLKIIIFVLQDKLDAVVIGDRKPQVKTYKNSSNTTENLTVLSRFLYFYCFWDIEWTLDSVTLLYVFWVISNYFSKISE